MAMKQEFEGHTNKAKHLREYEESLRRRLKDIIAEADEHAQREKRMCKRKESSVVMPLR